MPILDIIGSKYNRISFIEPDYFPDSPPRIPICSSTHAQLTRLVFVSSSGSVSSRRPSPTPVPNSTAYPPYVMYSTVIIPSPSSYSTTVSSGSCSACASKQVVSSAKGSCVCYSQNLDENHIQCRLYKYRPPGFYGRVQFISNSVQ